MFRSLCRKKTAWPTAETPRVRAPESCHAGLCGSLVRECSLNCYALPAVIVLGRTVRSGFAGGLPAARVLAAGAHLLSRLANFPAVGIRVARSAMIECAVTGLLAWRCGQPGQVGNE